MSIKSELIKILEKENYTFAQLADYLQMTEEKLTSLLQNNSLELRSLESISKVLRVPLYSFFRVDHSQFNYVEKPHYINQLWTGGDGDKSIEQLSKEIRMLKQIIAMKEEQLKKLNS